MRSRRQAAAAGAWPSQPMPPSSGQVANAGPWPSQPPNRRRGRAKWPRPRRRRRASRAVAVWPMQGRGQASPAKPPGGGRVANAKPAAKSPPSGGRNGRGHMGESAKGKCHKPPRCRRKHRGAPFHQSFASRRKRAGQGRRFSQRPALSIAHSSAAPEAAPNRPLHLRHRRSALRLSIARSSAAPETGAESATAPAPSAIGPALSIARSGAAPETDAESATASAPPVLRSFRRRGALPGGRGLRPLRP